MSRQSLSQTVDRAKVAKVSGHDWPLSSPGTLLFYVFAVYLVVPIVDVPLLELSLSAPVFAVLALEVFARLTGSDWRRYARWVLFAYTFWLAAVISIAGNVLLGTITDFGRRDVLTVVRWAYWLIVFVVTTVLVSSNAGLAKKVTRLVGLAIIAVALLRLGEALVFGRWGNGTSRIFTQNSYGWLFSAFTPYALLLLYRARRAQRVPAILAGLALLAAVAGNGSRSSWIAATVGAVIFMALYAFSQRGVVARLWLPVVLGVITLLAVSLLPDHILEPVEQRFASFESLETDKPYLVRQLLLQKSITMFSESPLIGKGMGRFTSTSVPLSIPGELSYGTEAGFNRRSAHNSYVALLGEAGLFGTIPYSILFLTLVVGGLRAAVQLARRDDTWPLAAYAGFIGASLHFWTLSGLTGTAPWFIYGLVAGIIQLERMTRPTMRAGI